MLAKLCWCEKCSGESQPAAPVDREWGKQQSGLAVKTKVLSAEEQKPYSQHLPHLWASGVVVGNLDMKEQQELASQMFFISG